MNLKMAERLFLMLSMNRQAILTYLNSFTEPCIKIKENVRSCVELSTKKFHISLLLSEELLPLVKMLLKSKEIMHF